MKKKIHTDRKTGIRWTGLSVGGDAAPQRLSVFIIYN